jgi:hypothetical protein
VNRPTTVPHSSSRSADACSSARSRPQSRSASGDLAGARAQFGHDLAVKHENYGRDSVAGRSIESLADPIESLALPPADASS